MYSLSSLSYKGQITTPIFLYDFCCCLPCLLELLISNAGSENQARPFHIQKIHWWAQGLCQKKCIVFVQLENIMEKEANTGYNYVLFFCTIFSKAPFLWVLKTQH